MATTVSLGFQVPDYGRGCLANSVPEPAKEPPTKTAYPSMTIPGNKGLARALKPGQTFQAMVTFMVSEVAIRDRKESDGMEDHYGTRVELEAQSMTFDNVKVEEAEEVDGATAFKSFLKAKNKGGESEE